jgi:sulfoxide reductase heme-binding subunit YedZ
MAPSRTALAAGKVVVFLLCLLPLAQLGLAVGSNALGPDPADVVVDTLGETALWLLLITLAVSPLRTVTGRSWLLRFRRMLGLFAFFYAGVHVLAYTSFILGWSFDVLLEDFVKRPYITMGIAALTLLLPLAVTSTRGWMRRLKHRWQVLHRLVYPATALAIVHMWWQQRSDYGEGLLYASVFVALMLLRWPPLRQRLSFG